MNNDQKRLSEVAKIITGIPESKTCSGTYRYRYIQPNHFSDNGELIDTAYIAREQPLPNEQLIQSGDVLIKRLNSKYSFAVEKLPEESTISQNLFIIRPCQEITTEYLAYLFEQKNVLSQIEHLSGTAAIIKAISAKKLAEIVIPIPPIRTQQILGQLWMLEKRHRKLLIDYVTESERFFSAIAERIQ